MTALGYTFESLSSPIVYHYNKVLEEEVFIIIFNYPRCGQATLLPIETHSVRNRNTQ